MDMNQTLHTQRFKYLILSSLYSHYKHQLGSKQVGTQHDMNVVTHVP